MEPLHSTIGSLARQMLDDFTRNEEQNGSQYWQLREEAQWQHHLLVDACKGAIETPQACDAVFKVLIEIYLAENREQAEEFLYDIEPYDNLTDLTAWLSASHKNVEYVTAVLRQENPSSGMEVLAKAHKLYLQEIGRRIVKVLQEYVLRNAYAEEYLN